MTAHLNRGHRIYVPAVLAVGGVVGVVLFGAVFIAATLAFGLFDDSFAPLYGPGYAPNKQDVRSQPERDSVLTPVRAGDNIYTWAEKCSHEDAVGVSGSGTLRRVKPIPIPPPVQITAGSRIATKGCIQRAFVTAIPMDTEPGTYVLTGTDQATNGAGDTQVRVWETEQFEVISR